MKSYYVCDSCFDHYLDLTKKSDSGIVLVDGLIIQNLTEPDDDEPLLCCAYEHAIRQGCYLWYHIVCPRMY